MFVAERAPYGDGEEYCKQKTVNVVVVDGAVDVSVDVFTPINFYQLIQFVFKLDKTLENRFGLTSGA